MDRNARTAGSLRDGDAFGADLRDEAYVDVDVSTLGLEALDETTRPPEPRDRRRAPRRQVAMLFNKYAGGTPFAAEALEISATGMLVRRLSEPNFEQACYAVEIGDPDGPTRWLCASPVWRHGDLEALTFVAHTDDDRAFLRAYVN